MYLDKVVAQLLDDIMIVAYEEAYSSPSYTAWMATVHDRRLAHKLWGDDCEGLTKDVVDDLSYDNEDEVEQLDDEEEHENLNRTMTRDQMKSEQEDEKRARVLSTEGFLRVLASDPLGRTELAEKILKEATDELKWNHVEIRVLRVMQEEGLQHMAQMVVGLLTEGMLFMVGVSPVSGRLVGLRLTQEIL